MKMTIIAPNDEVLIDNESLGTLEYNEVKDHAEANIVIRLSPFVIKHLGEYKLIIRILDKPYEYKFNFEKKVIK